MRNRSAVVVIQNDKVALIKRVRDGSVYYVFPGGGIEEGETPEVAAERESVEELGVSVNIKSLFQMIEFNGTQYFFLAEIVDGDFGTGKAEEYNSQNRDSGTYLPIWVDIEELPYLDVRPIEVSARVCLYYT